MLVIKFLDEEKIFHLFTFEESSERLQKRHNGCEQSYSVLSHSRHSNTILHKVEYEVEAHAYMNWEKNYFYPMDISPLEMPQMPRNGPSFFHGERYYTWHQPLRLEKIISNFSHRVQRGQVSILVMATFRKAWHC